MTHGKRLLPAALAILLAGCAADRPDSPGEWPRELGAPTTSAAARAAAPKVQEIMLEARRASDGGNLGGAAALYEEAIKLDPTNREALFALAAASQERALDLDRPRSSAPFLRAASAMRQLRAAYPSLSPEETSLLRSALYYEARTYAVEGHTERALESLVAAVDAGFNELKPLRAEADLEPVRNLPRFQELLKRVESESKALASRVAKELLAEQSFPFAFKLPSAAGGVVSLEDFRGKVVIADFWGTWCPPCRAELPHLMELSRKYKDRGLQVVGLNYEQVREQDMKSTINEFTKEAGVTYPCLIGDEKTMAQVPKFTGFPTTLFLDRTGKVRARLGGFNPDNSVGLLAIEEIITTLLAEQP